MATPPTFVAEYESAWTNAGTPKSVNVTTQPGDILAWLAATRDAGTTVNTLSAGGGGMAWSFPEFSLVASTCGLYIGIAQATLAETFTLTATAVSGTTVGFWGFNCLRFSGVSSIGAGVVNSPGASGVPSISITTLQANSAIVLINADWNAIDGAARSWLTNAGPFTEQSYARSAGNYAIYGGYHADSGNPGAKIVGLSNIAGQKYAIAALELQGVPGGGTTPDTNKRKRKSLLVR